MRSHLQILGRTWLSFRFVRAAGHSDRGLHSSESPQPAITQRTPAVLFPWYLVTDLDYPSCLETQSSDKLWWQGKWWPSVSGAASWSEIFSLSWRLKYFLLCLLNICLVMTVYEITWPELHGNSTGFSQAGWNFVIALTVHGFVFVKPNVQILLCESLPPVISALTSYL